jgi:hypothetical protein
MEVRRVLREAAQRRCAVLLSSGSGRIRGTSGGAGNVTARDAGWSPCLQTVSDTVCADRRRRQCGSARRSPLACTSRHPALRSRPLRLVDHARRDKSDVCAPTHERRRSSERRRSPAAAERSLRVSYRSLGRRLPRRLSSSPGASRCLPRSTPELTLAARISPPRSDRSDQNRGRGRSPPQRRANIFRRNLGRWRCEARLETVFVELCGRSLSPRPRLRLSADTPALSCPT